MVKYHIPLNYVKNNLLFILFALLQKLSSVEEVRHSLSHSLSQVKFNVELNTRLRNTFSIYLHECRGVSGTDTDK